MIDIPPGSNPLSDHEGLESIAEDARGRFHSPDVVARPAGSGVIDFHDRATNLQVGRAVTWQDHRRRLVIVFDRSGQVTNRALYEIVKRNDPVVVLP